MQKLRTEDIYARTVVLRFMMKAMKLLKTADILMNMKMMRHMKKRQLRKALL